jgi:fumarate reductase flavoprotein subunit
MKQVATDVAVIAAGTSGLAAAVTAAEGGARVIAFEKAATTGGTGNMGMGPFAVESRLQRLKQVPLTREQAFKIFMDYQHWRVDARLVKVFIDMSASTIDWLEKMGVEFVEPAAYFPGAYFVWHVVKPSGGGRPGPQSSATMMKILTERATELGVKIFLETPAKKILKEDGRVVGVVAEDKDGEIIQANAKAVIIATGGFGDNPEWIKKYTGYEWGRDIFSFRIPGLVGDGIRMAWEVGAAADWMDMQPTCGIPGEVEPVVFGLFRQPNLMVNPLGERFINEEILGNHHVAGSAIARQKNRCAFMILDEATKKYYEEKGLDHIVSVFPITKVENFDATLKQAIDQGNENLFMANSLEELAGKTGINLEGLRKTVDEYNKACDTGRDALFYKSCSYLKPVKQPKFYAGRFFPGSYGSRGGIRINHKTEVITKDHEVIPGLYAAGMDACSIFADTYPGILAGSAMSFALSSGRIAGENAAKYVKSVAK